MWQRAESVALAQNSQDTNQFEHPVDALEK